VAAPPDWHAIDFLSDLHLSRDTPLTFDRLTRHLGHTPAQAVFILGDLFEAWVGDDARHSGFEAECARMLREAASRRHIGFMRGNRDFLVGADLLEACGLQPLNDPTVMLAFGDRLLLTHGDLLCIDDIDYQRFRSQVRSAAWQADFLARPLAERRLAAAQMREQSRQHQARQKPAAAIDADAATAAAWMRSAGTPTLVHGHTHRPGTDSVGPGLTRHVLSDWDFDHPGSARGDVLRWRRDGLTRVAPTLA
jgi:UDP-2,3-diacylglucosamine hydrolase